MLYGAIRPARADFSTDISADTNADINDEQARAVIPTARDEDQEMPHA